jgi:hypothetical protein
MDVKELSKELEEFMDLHCECPSKQFNRAGCIEQIILNHISVQASKPKKTVMSFIREDE